MKLVEALKAITEGLPFVTATKDGIDSLNTYENRNSKNFTLISENVAAGAESAAVNRAQDGIGFPFPAKQLVVQVDIGSGAPIVTLLGSKDGFDYYPVSAPLSASGITAVNILPRWLKFSVTGTGDATVTVDTAN